MANTPDPIGTPGGVLEIEESEPKVDEPPRYNVVLLNDDYTPMEFVVGVLERFFAMDREQAVRGDAACPYPGQGDLRNLLP